MERFISGEPEKIFRVNSHRFLIGLTIDGKHAWQQEEEQKGDISNCTDNLGIIVCLRALQGRSGRNLIHPTLQDNVIIERGLFHHIYHIGCAFFSFTIWLVKITCWEEIKRDWSCEKRTLKTQLRPWTKP